MEYRRLPLEGLRNARDLGGYPLPDGRATRYRQFIRCEVPKSLTQRDLDFLKAYGVTVSIDFRGDLETSRHPSCFEDIPWVEYRRCPTFDKQVAFASGGGGSDKSRPAMDSFVDWGEKYIELISNGRNWVRDTLIAMAEARGAVIYNCTTGKDRTGVISALLLGLAGVADEDIIADYCVSELYLTEIYKELLAEYLKRWPNEKAGAPNKIVGTPNKTVGLDNPFFKTAPENMATLLDYLREHCGGIGEYVKSCGVSGDAIAALRERLVL